MTLLRAFASLAPAAAASSNEDRACHMICGSVSGYNRELPIGLSQLGDCPSGGGERSESPESGQIATI
jgi:hypothetical protein